MKREENAARDQKKTKKIPVMSKLCREYQMLSTTRFILRIETVRRFHERNSIFGTGKQNKSGIWETGDEIRYSDTIRNQFTEK